MQVATVLSHACDSVRKQFTRGELGMLVDIFNSTMLMPQMLGSHVVVQVEDSFSLYPGMYEDKWEVRKDEMLGKIKALTALESALIELWAVGFWSLDNVSNGLEAYLSGQTTLVDCLSNEAKLGKEGE